MKYQIKPLSFIVPLVLGLATWYLSGDFSIGAAIFAILLLPALIELYIPYAKDNPKSLWFKRKIYGWGWVPVTWQGWLVTLLFAALIAGFAMTIDESSTPQEIAFTFVLPVTLLAVTLIRICYKKGESPKWQWGIDKGRK